MGTSPMTMRQTLLHSTTQLSVRTTKMSLGTAHHLNTEVARRMVSIAVSLYAARGKAADVTGRTSIGPLAIKHASSSRVGRGLGTMVVGSTRVTQCGIVKT